MLDYIHQLIGKEVEVEAHGIIYRGVLIEVGEENVYLKAESGWITIPTGDVTDMNLLEP